MVKRLFVTLALICYATFSSAQNYDESKIPPYDLQDPLVFADGHKVRNKKQWKERRLEILEIFQSEMYGRMPAAPSTLELETIEEGKTMGNYATRKQVRMYFSKDKSGPNIDWLIVTPNHLRTPAPVILLLNYYGNHTVLNDEEIIVTDGWMRNNKDFNVENNSASAASRGKMLDPDLRSIIPINMLVARGYAVVTACYADISPDPDSGVKTSDGKLLQDEFAYTGIFDLWGERDNSRSDNTTALTAWGWALMRGMDLICKDPQLDAKKVILTGSSRLGKAALIAAAFDERFPLLAVNQTGGGGVPLAKHYYGENVQTMTTMFTHWYCKAFAKYANKESEMPFDQHMFLSCIAPRALMVQGFNEGWFDTKGEYLALKAASPVWKFLGEEGLPNVDYPENYDKSAVGNTLAYYRRDNAHGISAIDWVWMLEFAETYFNKK